MSNDWRTSPEVDQRVDDVLARMTLEEKVDLVTGDQDFGYAFYNAPIERVGIPALTMADGPAGARVNNMSVNGGRNTALPAPIALAATWEPALARRYGEILGAEAFATGHNVQLAPAVDIARAPRGGRTFESFGEDPLLQARMVVPEIHGIQAHPGPGHDQALHRQQPGVPALHGRRPGRRADAARDLPAAVRGRDPGGRCRRGDGLLQPGERHVRLRAPRPPDRRPARRARIPRLGDERLRRHVEHRGRRRMPASTRSSRAGAVLGSAPGGGRD